MYEFYLLLIWKMTSSIAYHHNHKNKTEVGPTYDQHPAFPEAFGEEKGENSLHRWNERTSDLSSAQTQFTPCLPDPPFLPHSTAERGKECRKVDVIAASLLPRDGVCPGRSGGSSLSPRSRDGAGCLGGPSLSPSRGTQGRTRPATWAPGAGDRQLWARWVSLRWPGPVKSGRGSSPRAEPQAAHCSRSAEPSRPSRRPHALALMRF